MNRLAIPSAVASGPVGTRAIDRRKTGINSTPGVSPTTQDFVTEACWNSPPPNWPRKRAMPLRRSSRTNGRRPH